MSANSKSLPPHLSPPPSSPLEILMPEGRYLVEPPRLAGKTISFLVASHEEVNIVEIDVQNSVASFSNSELGKFLVALADGGQLDTLIQQWRAILYPPSEDGSIGSLGCLQQGWFHSFAVRKLSSPPHLKWELRRTSRKVQVDGST